jgi:hypothetical protein
MTLFEECLEALGKDTTILTDNGILNKFESCIPMVYIADSIWSRIDWTKISNKVSIHGDIFDVLEILKNNLLDTNANVFILWNEATLPIIETKLSKVLECIDDVTAVGFDTWIYCPSNSYVIEFYHEGETTLGIIENQF